MGVYDGGEAVGDGRKVARGGGAVGSGLGGAVVVLVALQIREGIEDWIVSSSGTRFGLGRRAALG